MADVILDRVTKTYSGSGGVPAVRDVSLRVDDGSFVVLVGPSGCGKSTTLRLIAGLEELSSGTISIGGRVVNDLPPKDRDIAMVFQNYALYPHMSVYRNMAFALKLRRVPKAQIEQRVRQAARTLGIEDLLDRKPRALSGGQRQRVALGRAIVREPRAFLFDEPLSNLDAKLRVSTRAELKALHQRLATTTIYVTHDQEEAMTLGDQVVVMAGGVIQQVGPPLTVYREPVNRFVAGFIGTPAMNFLDGRIVRDNGSVRFVIGDSAAGSVPLTARAAHSFRAPESGSGSGGAGGVGGVLGVRPQAITVSANGASGLPARIALVEPLGDQVDLICTLPGSGPQLLARVPATSPFAPGDSVTLSIDPQRLHVFAPGDFGANLTLAPA